MEDRPGFPHQPSPNGEARSTTSLNPIARAAAMTSQATGQVFSAPVPPPSSTVPASPTSAPTPPVAPTPAVAASSPSASTPGASLPSVGKLAHVAPSRLWKDDTAFAAWLAHNLEALGEVLAVQLRDGKMPHAETPVIVAADVTGAAVVIVTELGDSSDEGFGRLVRNVAASGAKHAVWVCGEPGAEYGASVSWLNRVVDARVSMVKVTAVTIGESAAAPMFEVAVRTQRADDEGVESSVPAADSDSASTRRVDDWLDSVAPRRGKLRLGKTGR